MLLKQIKYFIPIVNENSFTEAAEKDFVSQSAISQAMNSPGKELGVKLLERGNRRFHVTAAGKHFYRRGKALLADLERIKIRTARLSEVSEAIQRILLLKEGRRVTRRYCLFWQKARASGHIEAFAHMLQAKLI